MAAFPGRRPPRIQTRCNSRHDGRPPGGGRIFGAPPRSARVPGPDLDGVRNQKPTTSARAWIPKNAPLGFNVQVTSRARQQGSDYLGHAHVNDTYWYIEAVPELLQLATERVTAQPAGGGR